MLNRRFLRVKAFQSLFSFKQACEANKQIVLDEMKDRFMPNLNSMQPMDTDELRAKRELSVALFREHLKSQNTLSDEEDVPDEIKLAVKDAFNAYDNKRSKELSHCINRAEQDFDGIEKNLIRVLQSLIEFAHLADQRMNDPVKSKKLKHNLRLLAECKLLKKLSDWDGLQKRRIKKLGDMDDMLPSIRKSFTNEILESEYLEKFLNGPGGFEEEKEFVLELIRKGVLKSPHILEYFQENDLSWGLNDEIVKSLALRVVKDLPDLDTELQFPSLSQNWEEDLEFFKKLMRGFAEFEPMAENLLKKRVSNWDYERVALSDQVILALALTEVHLFHNIPVKVSVNEYIEVAKNYSTPESKKFVNGVLENVLKDMQGQGLIKKSGRGLIDNK